MRALALQHIACEPPGLYADLLAERGATLTSVELDEGEPLPDWRQYDVVIAMGGPMSVNDEAALPWLVDEKRLIADVVRAGRPFWGACLGSQLLASALGATVRAGAAPEVGVMPVTLTRAAADDPVFKGLPDAIPTLQWHGDTFELPAGATLLASSDAYPHQAIRWGTVAYGVQFHLEVSVGLAREWARVPEYEAALESVHGPGALEALIADLAREGDAIAAVGRTVFARWLDLADAAIRRAATPARA